MEIYIIENYKERYPLLKGSELTDKLTQDCLIEYGVETTQILRTPKGKPYIDLCKAKKKATIENVEFSVSHSSSVFACIISDKAVGIDIQETRSASAEKIANRYFDNEEIKFIEDNGEKGFFIIWTRKEAYSKLTGKGLEEIMGGASVLNRTDVEFNDFMLGDGMYCSYCVEI